jgi:hypothetical protein
MLLKSVSLALASVALLAAPAAMGAACKDAKGRFMKCPPKPAPKMHRCKDAHGKFAKCGMPGTHPV